MIKTILFIFIFLIISLGGILVFRHRKKFGFVIRVFLVLMSIHFLLVQLNIRSPIPLLYGPLIMLMCKNVQGIPIHRTLSILHIVPFVFFMGVYTLVEYGIQVPYYPFYPAALALSLLGYGLYVLLDGRRNITKITDKIFLVYQLCFMCIVASLFVWITVLKTTNILSGDLGLDITLVLSLTLLLSYLFIIRYLMVGQRKKRALLASVSSFQADVLLQSNDLPSYQKIVLNQETFLDYEKRVITALVESKLYLSPELSLDRLAKETDIPKHHFSQLFSVYLKTSFYQLIANYRIAHAIELLDEGSNITVEFLAYECGFNSKSSFNRYFKEIVGCTPSEYLNSKNA